MLIEHTMSPERPTGADQILFLCNLCILANFAMNNRGVFNGV